MPAPLIAAGLTMWIGVSKAGYSVAEKAPIFLVVFAVPAAVALLVLWRLSRGKCTVFLTMGFWATRSRFAALLMVAAQVVRHRCLPTGLLVAAAVLGGVPMAVHGYRILFLGTRLF